VNADEPSGLSLTSPDTDQRAGRPESRRSGLALVTYWVEAGVVSTAAGAWASTAFPRSLRILIWAGVTTLLAAAAIWAGEPAIAFLSRHYEAARRRRPDGS
jgi:hypothetical protein